MNAGVLRQYLSALADALRGSGAKAASEDLLRVAEALQPFQDWTLAHWASFLQQAEGYYRTGTVPVTTRRRSVRSVDESKVQQALERIRQLEAQSTAADFSLAQLDSTLRQVEKQLSKEETLILAEHLGWRGCKTKKAALAKIAESIRARRMQQQRLALIQST
ncbi:hypothetical protein HRbin36_00093 [bacterium HR36]|nr:hypothetical protein HRbin36_00093 [bacterium HR36]